MTKERMNELLPVMQAFADGKPIELRGTSANHDSRWLSTVTPIWSNDFEYRVKPEPRVPDTLWIVSHDTDPCWGFGVCRSLAEAQLLVENRGGTFAEGLRITEFTSAK